MVFSSFFKISSLSSSLQLAQIQVPDGRTTKSFLFGYSIQTANKEDLNVNEENLNQAEAPTLPQVEDRKEDDILSVDVQKQLEAKFDELFGPFDEEDSVK